jgi:hypothetical protein
MEAWGYSPLPLVSAVASRFCSRSTVRFVSSHSIEVVFKQVDLACFADECPVFVHLSAYQGVMDSHRVASAMCGVAGNARGFSATSTIGIRMRTPRDRSGGHVGFSVLRRCPLRQSGPAPPSRSSREPTRRMKPRVGSWNLDYFVPAAH